MNLKTALGTWKNMLKNMKIIKANIMSQINYIDMKTVTIDQLIQKKGLMYETKSKTPFSGVSLSYLKFLEQVL